MLRQPQRPAMKRTVVLVVARIRRLSVLLFLLLLLLLRRATASAKKKKPVVSLVEAVRRRALGRRRAIDKAVGFGCWVLAGEGRGGGPCVVGVTKIVPTK